MNAPQTVTPGTVVTVKTAPGETYRIVTVDLQETRPNTREDLLRRGYDGCFYVAERVTEGTRKRAQTVYLHRGLKSGAYSFAFSGL